MVEIVRNINKLYMQFVNVESDHEWSLANVNSDLRLYLDQNRLFLSDGKSQIQIEISFDPIYVDRVKNSHLLEIIFQWEDDLGGYRLVGLYPSLNAWNEPSFHAEGVVVVLDDYGDPQFVGNGKTLPVKGFPFLINREP